METEKEGNNSQDSTGKDWVMLLPEIEIEIRIGIETVTNTTAQ
jgi:hypothetical protein